MLQQRISFAVTFGLWGCVRPLAEAWKRPRAFKIKKVRGKVAAALPLAVGRSPCGFYVARTPLLKYNKSAHCRHGCKRNAGRIKQTEIPRCIF